MHDVLSFGYAITHSCLSRLLQPNLCVSSRLTTNQVIMYFRGFCNLCFFYGCWLGGALIIPFAIINAILRITYIPTYILIVYFSYRFFFKANKWNFMRKMLCINDTPYCNSSKYVRAWMSMTFLYFFILVLVCWDVVSSKWRNMLWLLLYTYTYTYTYIYYIT